MQQTRYHDRSAYMKARGRNTVSVLTGQGSGTKSFRGGKAVRSGRGGLCGGRNLDGAELSGVVAFGQRRSLVGSFGTEDTIGSMNK